MLIVTGLAFLAGRTEAVVSFEVVLVGLETLGLDDGARGCPGLWVVATVAASREDAPLWGANVAFVAGAFPLIAGAGVLEEGGDGFL